MKPIFLFCSIFLVKFIESRSIENESIEATVRIGVEVSITTFPFIVQLSTNKETTCAGSIIGENWIITSAHCTYGYKACNFVVRAGAEWRDDGGDIVTVSEVHTHPEYLRFTSDYDVSLLKLSEFLKSGPNIRPIVVVEKGNYTKPNARTIVLGWGFQGNEHEKPVQLRGVGALLHPYFTCKKTFTSFFTNRMICAGNQQEHTDVCQGDSGGPMIYDNKLIGIASWGIGCSRLGLPGVYTDLAHPGIRRFITEVTGL